MSTSSSSSPVYTNYKSFDDVEDRNYDGKRSNHHHRTANRREKHATATTTTVTRTVNEDPLASSNLADDAAAASSHHNKNRPNNNNNNHRRTEQSPNDNNNNKHNKQRDINKYRGFTTSIHDMYLHAEHERTDCCAITCCGMLQSDRDRYLLTGVTPPSVLKRCTMHVLLPLTIFLGAGVCAMRIQPKYLNEMVCLSLIGLLLFYFVMQCVKGRSKRRGIRKDLLFTKYQIQLQQGTLQSLSPRSYGRTLNELMDQDRPDDDDEDMNHHNRGSNNNNQVPPMDQEYLLGQTRRDIRCAHPCCLIACYPEDRMHRRDNDDVDADDDDIKTNPCSDLLNIFLNPVCCGMAVQCCGVCAIAQEAREIERFILPASYRRIDYITMEPFLNYYPAIYEYKEAARGNNNNNNATTGNNNNNNNNNNTANASSHLLQQNGDTENEILGSSSSSKIPKTFGVCGIPLSRLSYRLLQTFSFYILLMLGWGIASPYYWKYAIGKKAESHHLFGIWDYVILLATFGHAIFLTAIIVWFTNYKVTTKAPGSKPVHSQLSLDAMIKFFSTGFFLSASLAFFWEVVAVLCVDSVISITLAISGVDVMQDSVTSNDNGGDSNDNGASGDDDASSSVARSMFWRHTTPSYHLTHIMGSSFETSHFLSSYTNHDGLEEEAAAAGSPDYMDVFGMDHPWLYTIYLAVGAFCVAALIEELCKYFGYRMAEEHPDFLSQEALEEASMIVHARRRAFAGEDEDEDDETNDPENAAENDPIGAFQFSNQLKSLQAHGAAITLAMVTTAIGFSCCENLIYIFIYAGSSVSLELGVLIERSFFPLHPIVAAIQSIGVCQRDLERSRTHHLGKILLPSVIVHGCFDFFILWIDFVGKRKGQSVEDGDLRITNTAELCSVTSCVVVMFAALIYFTVQTNNQRERLAALDANIAVGHSSLL